MAKNLILAKFAILEVVATVVEPFNLLANTYDKLFVETLIKSLAYEINYNYSLFNPI